ncbi:hypothetical protein HanPSC8_Chr17g0771761 [Helianthus annuus]|nr:hypothetical protein HanPSC8_Chr17g0771761 [Helianthus annuus]
MIQDMMGDEFYFGAYKVSLMLLQLPESPLGEKSPVTYISFCS